MTNEKAIMCLEDMKIKVPIPKAAKQARENNEALDVAIKALQSAEPKRGKWILAKEQRQEDTENGNYMYNCSNCGCGDLHSKAVKVSYCWNCGADMRGEQDG